MSSVGEGGPKSREDDGHSAVDLQQTRSVPPTRTRNYIGRWCLSVSAQYSGPVLIHYVILVPSAMWISAAAVSALNSINNTQGIYFHYGTYFSTINSSVFFVGLLL